jgi:preprotein translocase subunit SecG
MKAWLKGGLWGVGIHLVYYLVLAGLVFLSRDSGETLAGWIFIWTELAPIAILFAPFGQFVANSIFGFIVSGIIVTIFWFLIGAVIGYIISKVKSRNQFK